VAYIPAGELTDREGYVVAQVSAYALAQREVTCGEYLEFLNDSATLGQVDATAGTTLVPRDGTRMLWRRNADGRFALERTDGGGALDPAWPMAWISVGDALAYASWRANRDHQPWRLPTLEEWQLAVQGGDGRGFSWGLRGDPVHCASAFTVPTGAWCASPVGGHPADRSVQGVYDLGGSLAEMVADAALGVDARRARLAAGGSYLDRQSEQFGVHSLRSTDRATPGPAIGFRLALSLTERH
jgi:formylglycine-generating enzyme required for sulfatase activity